jgi:hypothetical protein
MAVYRGRHTSLSARTSHHAAVIGAAHQITECDLSFRILGGVTDEDRLQLIDGGRRRSKAPQMGRLAAHTANS